MLRNSAVNPSCSKDLYLYAKSLKIILKSNSYLMSISRRRPLTLSNSFFLNVNLPNTVENLPVASNVTENGCNNLFFPLLSLQSQIKITFWSDVTCPSLPGKSVHPIFPQYQLYEKSWKFNCWFKIKPKSAVRISICT